MKNSAEEIRFIINSCENQDPAFFGNKTDQIDVKVENTLINLIRDNGWDYVRPIVSRMSTNVSDKMIQELEYIHYHFKF